MNHDQPEGMTRKEFMQKTALGIVGLSLTNSLAKDTKPQSQYRLFGRTGIKVTAVGFGASRTQEPSLVKAALDAGINFFDTGRSYANGQNEVMLGNVIKGIRAEVVIQSRGRLNIREKGEQLKTPKITGRIRDQLDAELDASLKALQTDYIDIYQIHDINSLDILNHEAVWEFFAAAKKAGKIHACGFSSHSNQIELVKSANETRFYDSFMVPYNHKGSYVHSRAGYFAEWDQSALEAEFKKAGQNGIGIVAMKTCSGGAYSPGDQKPATYRDALKWILQHNYISTMAVAMGNMTEIKENVGAM